MDHNKQKPDSKKKLFFGLFVFPLLIAVGMAVLLCTVVLLTKEEETPESLITAIKTGAPSKRWQKAFELSNELNREGGILRSTGIKKEIIHILNDSDHYDAKTRAYMAMALGRFRDAEAEEALRRSLGRVDEKAEEATLPLFLMWAIGQYENPASAESILPYTKSEQAPLRKTAAYVLGALKNARAIPDLTRLLEDPVLDVRWNAALSLARLGSDKGSLTLLQMLDRHYLENSDHLDESNMEQVMVNAAKAVALIREQTAVPLLENLSKADKSLKVRQASLSALEQIGNG